MEAARIPESRVEGSVETGIQKPDIARQVGYLALAPELQEDSHATPNPYKPIAGESYNYFRHNDVLAHEFDRQHPPAAA